MYILFQDLDNFKLSPLTPPNLIRSEKELKVHLKNFTLPGEKSGNFFLTCQQLPTPSSINRSQCLYDRSLEWFECKCSNLTPGTSYILNLEHRLDTFATREYTIEDSYTSTKIVPPYKH
jgi:hypothetical protein